MSLLPTYIHIVNPKLRHIYLSFNDEGELIIKSPKVSQKDIEKLLIKKAAWITKAKKKLQNKKGKALHFSGEEALYFLGEAHPLRLVTYDKKRTKLTFDGDTFTLYYSIYDEQTFQKHIDAFYKKEAQAYIPSILDEWAARMQLHYKEVRFRKTKRQWGSCSSRNTISFNTMIMKLPIDVIQYIIVHELAHIKHKHHQKAFWDLIAHYLPEYKVQTAMLKHFTT